MRLVIIILSFGISNFIYSQDSLNCEEFRVGKYDTYVNGVLSSKVKRTDKYQYEYSPKTGSKIKLEIIWIDDCTYKLVFIKGNREFWENRGTRELHPVLIIKIVAIDGDRYDFEASFEGVEDFMLKSSAVKTK
jgi:hypothetical protein